jgi:DNA invertase Pin-like site-specific DNA recombinase
MRQCTLYSRHGEDALEQCAVYAQAMGWQVVGEFSDPENAHEIRRIGLLEAIEQTPPGGTLVVWRAQDIGRNSGSYYAVTQDIAQRTMDVVIVDKSTLDAGHEAVAEIVANAVKSATMWKEHKRNTAQRRQIVLGVDVETVPQSPAARNKRPYGETPEEQAIIQRVVELKEQIPGIAWTRIATMLVAEGYKPRGKRFKWERIERMYKREMLRRQMEGKG